MPGGVTDLWQPFVADPARSAILTDLDGTIADIVDDPAAACPCGGAVEVLAALASRFALMAVLSGRPMSYLADLMPDPTIALAGLYGLERRLSGERIDDAGAGVWREVVADVMAAAASAANPGIRAESKGLSLTLHYRERPDAADFAADWAAAQARRTGLVVRPARMSIELHPPIAVDKGTTLLDLVRRAAPIVNVCFVGDDVGDLPAFDALDTLAATGTHTVRVAVASAEVAPELVARADQVVDGPAAAVTLLRVLLDG